MNDDYYKILGIQRGASADEIKSAYRKLAHKHHPDKSGGDEAMFKKINEAYQVLSNEEKRAQYDRFGKTFDGSGFGGGRQGQGQGFDWRNFSDGFEFGFDPNNMGDGSMGDIFDAFFEGMGVKRKRRAYERGSDLELVEDITLEEAFHGVKKQVHFTTYVMCEKCSGVGHFPKEGFTPCASCDGQGQIQESRKTFFGNISQVKTCEKCHGLGKIPKKSCAHCKATGRVQHEKSIEVAIVAGIGDNQLIKIPRAGEMGARGAEPGDLYIRVHVKPHKTFMRNGDDLVIKQHVSLIDLLIEKRVKVGTLDGKEMNVSLPSRYKIGDPVIVDGSGMPRLGLGGRGRLIVNVETVIPEKIGEKAKKLLEDLKRELE